MVAIQEQINIPVCFLEISNSIQDMASPLDLNI